MDAAEKPHQKKISQMQRSIDNAKIYIDALQEANRVYTSVGWESFLGPTLAMAFIRV